MGHGTGVPQRGCSSRGWSGSVLVSVFMWFTQLVQGKAWPFHRPSQHSGNELHFSFWVPPKFHNSSATKKKRQSKETRECFSTFCLTTLQAAASLMRTSAQTMSVGRNCFGGEEKDEIAQRNSRLDLLSSGEAVSLAVWSRARNTKARRLCLFLLLLFLSVF